MNTNKKSNPYIHKKSKHNVTIDKLINRLESSGLYKSVGKNVEYRGSTTQDVIGEIDAYAHTRINGKNYMLIFEVKQNHSVKGLKMAMDQLLRSKKFYEKHVDKVYSFYVTSGEESNYYLRDDLQLRGDLKIRRVRFKK